MKGSTLLVSRLVNLHEHYKRKLEEMRFWDVIVTNAENGELDALIDRVQPSIMIISSMFYQSATPYMMAILKRRHTYLNIAAVSISEYPTDLGVKFICNGVNSYVTYTDGVKQFYNAFEILRKGDTYISPSVAERMDKRRDLPTAATEIRENEIEVLRHICNGYTSKETGKELNLSKRAVYYYKSGLFNKLGVRNENELIRVALHLKLVNLDELNFYGGNNVLRTEPNNRYGIRGKNAN